MPDIPSVIAAGQNIQAASQAASAGAAATNNGLAALQVAITDITQALENLNRSIQVAATPAALTLAPASDPGAADMLTLTTSLGEITVALPQLDVAAQQSLLQQLEGLIDAGRSLTLGLSPGSPPAQGILLLPAAAATPAQDATGNAQRNLSPSTLPPLAAGDEVPALVLPSDIAVGPASAGAVPASQAQISAPAQQAPQDPPAQETAPATAQTAAAPIAPEPAGNPPPSVLQIAATGAETTAPPVTEEPPPETLPAPASAPPQDAAQTQATLPATAPPPQIIGPAANAAPQLPATMVAPPQTLAALLQPGNEVTLHIDAVLPPQAGTPSLPPLASNQIAATVTGTGTDGQLILKTADATLFVKAQAAAPIGSTVILSVGAGRTESLVTFPPIEPLSFQSLPQALAALVQNDPQILQQVLASRMPQPNEAMPGALLFLFGAFKQGNVRGWLGDDAVDALNRAGKYDLLNGLSRELGGAGQTAQDAVVGEWKSYPIPLLAQHAFQALTVYVHEDRDGRGQDRQGQENPAKMRFLIDMQLSKLGAMQIDGFVQAKKLDMILRSETRLPEGLHNDLRGAYIKAMGAVGYTGSLNFQVGRKHWMTMQRPSPPAITT